MKLVTIEQQTSKSPNHFFVWGDEMAVLYKDTTITHIAQQFGDVMRVVKVDDLVKAPYVIRCAKTFRAYFQWDLADLEITIIK